MQGPCSSSLKSSLTLSLFRLSGKHSLKRIDFTHFERKVLIFKLYTFLHCVEGWASGVCYKEQKVGRKGNVFNLPGITSSRLIKWIPGVGIQWEWRQLQKQQKSCNCRMEPYILGVLRSTLACDQNFFQFLTGIKVNRSFLEKTKLLVFNKKIIIPSLVGNWKS